MHQSLDFLEQILQSTEPTQKPRAKHWQGSAPEFDDFGYPIRSVFYDARTIAGPWAIMNRQSFIRYSTQRLGPGQGQEFTHQPDDTWLKTRG